MILSRGKKVKSNDSGRIRRNFTWQRKLKSFSSLFCVFAAQRQPFNQSVSLLLLLQFIIRSVLQNGLIFETSVGITVKTKKIRFLLGFWILIGASVSCVLRTRVWNFLLWFGFSLFFCSGFIVIGSNPVFVRWFSSERSFWISFRDFWFWVFIFLGEKNWKHGRWRLDRTQV